MERFRLDTDHNILFNQEENMTDDQKLEFYKMAFNAIFDRNLYLSSDDRATADMAVSFRARDLARQLIKSADEMIEEQEG